MPVRDGPYTSALSNHLLTLSGSPQHLVFDRGHLGGQVAEGLCCLRALAREMGDHIPEVTDFLAKPRVLAD